MSVVGFACSSDACTVDASLLYLQLISANIIFLARTIQNNITFSDRHPYSLMHIIFLSENKVKLALN